MVDDVLEYMEVELAECSSSCVHGTVVVCARAGDSDALVGRDALPYCRTRRGPNCDAS